MIIEQRSNYCTGYCIIKPESSNWYSARYRRFLVPWKGGWKGSMWKERPEMVIKHIEFLQSRYTQLDIEIDFLRGELRRKIDLRDEIRSRQIKLGLKR